MVRKDKLLAVAAFLGLAICVGFSIACLGGGGGGGGGGTSSGGAVLPSSAPALNGYAAELVQGDSPGALTYVAADIEQKYQEIFTELEADGMAALGAALQAATLVSEENGVAVYEVTFTLGDGQVVRTNCALGYSEGQWRVID